MENKKILNELENLNKEKEQLELAIKLRKDLEKLNNDQLKMVEKEISKYTKFQLTNYGKQNIKNWINSFGIIEVLESTNIAFLKYFNPENNNSFEFAFNKIGGICYNRRIRKEEQQDGR